MNHITHHYHPCSVCSMGELDYVFVGLADGMLAIYDTQQIIKVGYTHHDDVINGNIFRVTGLSWGKSIGHRWIPRINASDTELFSLICVWINGWVNNGEAGDLRRHRAHYDVTAMLLHAKAVTENRELSWCLLCRHWRHHKVVTTIFSSATSEDIIGIMKTIGTQCLQSMSYWIAAYGVFVVLFMISFSVDSLFD